MQARLVKTHSGARKPAQDPVELLADRELEVFELMGRGFNTRRIAEELGVGIKSIEVYRTRIKEKLEVQDATELLFRAIQWAHEVR